MNGVRRSKDREPGCTMSAATKMTPAEIYALDALADMVGLSRYEFIRQVLRDRLDAATFKQ